MIKDRIKELREKNGLTISAFAKSLGISPTSASLYESGKQNPGKKTIAIRLHQPIRTHRPIKPHRPIRPHQPLRKQIIRLWKKRREVGDLKRRMW